METYEKRYREALKWIESIYTELSHERQMEAEAFFPELKESGDEKKELRKIKGEPLKEKLTETKGGEI